MYRFRTELKYSDVTPKAVWMNRRALMAGAGGALAASTLGLPAAAGIEAAPSPYSTDAAPNSFDDITRYNNFYEFGPAKGDPAKNAGRLSVAPWSIVIDGLVDKPGTYGLDDLTRGIALEERIYRLRCVEAWSMIVPWIGFPLATVLERAGVQPGARYVAFETLVRPSEMPGQKYNLLDWPYREGLRLDEAMHPLAILATGLYGEAMPNQNGAPIRLVVPWKYGFKSIKSIVRITLTEAEPYATWNRQNPREYGFYSNVNPEVDHPRWSQASERRIGGGLLTSRQRTLMFNGYGDEVAGLYAGMDLKKYF